MKLIECDDLTLTAEDHDARGIRDCPDDAVGGVAQHRGDVGWPQDRISSTVAGDIRSDGRGRHHSRRTGTGRVKREDVQRHLVRRLRLRTVEHIDLVREDIRAIHVDVSTKPDRSGVSAVRNNAMWLL
jgi:hypothetical protein